MTSPFIWLPFSVPGLTDYPISPTDIALLVDLGYEPEADAHWVINDATGLTDRIGGKVLVRALRGTVTGGTGYPASSETALTFSGGTGSGAAGYAVINSSGVPTEILMTNHGSYTAAPTATISTAGGGSGATVTITLGAAPSFASGWLTTTTGYNGLATPINDTAENTVFAIVKRASIAQVIFDNGASANVGVDPGAALVKLGSSGSYRAYTGGLSLQNVDGPGANGDWLFVAMTFKPGVGRTVFWGNGTTYFQAGTKTLRSTPPCIGIGPIGNCFTGSLGGGLDVLELGYVARAIVANEFVAFSTRGRIRQAPFGRTVF